MRWLHIKTENLFTGCGNLGSAAERARHAIYQATPQHYTVLPGSRENIFYLHEALCLFSSFKQTSSGDGWNTFTLYIICFGWFIDLTH